MERERTMTEKFKPGPCKREPVINIIRTHRHSDRVVSESVFYAT